MDDTPEEVNITNLDFEISPLRAAVMHVHEIHGELLKTGFSKQEAAEIAAHMLYDVMNDGSDGDDIDEEYEDEDDLDERDL